MVVIHAMYKHISLLYSHCSLVLLLLVRFLSAGELPGALPPYPAIGSLSALAMARPLWQILDPHLLEQKICIGVCRMPILRTEASVALGSKKGPAHLMCFLYIRYCRSVVNFGAAGGLAVCRTRIGFHSWAIIGLSCRAASTPYMTTVLYASLGVCLEI